jgi:hypothetical protein
MSSNNVISDIAIPLLGVFVGVGLSVAGYKINHQTSLKEKAFSLLDEYYSSEFTEHRLKAEFALSKHSSGNLRDLYMAALGVKTETNSEITITPEEYHHISAVMHFFSKVSKLKRQKLVDVKTLNNVLGDEIAVWLGSRSHFGKRLSQVEDKDFKKFIETIKFASIDYV